LFPGRGKPDGLKSARRSAEARLRLKVSGYYRRIRRFSGTGLPNVSHACRHFGINRSKFYYWKNRFDKTNLLPLENRPTVPLKRNRPKYSREPVREVRTIRANEHTYPARKIRPRRDKPYPDIPGRAAVGRPISRENLFFRATPKSTESRRNPPGKSRSPA
jgi:hypothetical protein